MGCVMILLSGETETASAMKYEYVYLLTNPAMPEWIKVGKTNNIEKRIRDLSKKTAVPLPFECEAALKVPAENVFKVEKSLHDLLGFSVDSEKEFFRASAETVLKYFKTIQPITTDCTFILKEDLNKENPVDTKKAAKTTFELLQIPVGSELVFVGDKEKVCVVADGINQVSYNGETYALSVIAEMFCGYHVSGYQKFTYNGELLYDRRQRLHPEL